MIWWNQRVLVAVPEETDIPKNELVKQDSKEKPSKKDDKKSVKDAKGKPQTPGGPVPPPTKKCDAPGLDYLIYATFLNPPTSDPPCKFSDYKKMANTSEKLRQVSLGRNFS